MKNILPVLLFLLAFHTGYGQITITASDMPVSGDTLRYSYASPVGATISAGDSGASMTWNYPLSPIRQSVDTYQSALSVNFLYVATIGLTAYGYKVADSFPLPLPGLSIRQIYTFFEIKNGPSRFQAQAFAANISGLPAAFNYTKPDVWYFFPLNYLRYDSSNYALNITVPTLGAIKQRGYRNTRVDGWGTITTPYYTTPVNCIRVRSEIHEIDSLSLLPIAFPRNSVEYKWLVNGDHYPALWVTSNILPTGGEQITSIRYRDNPLPDTASGVPVVTGNMVSLKAWPNPSANGIVTLDLPSGWKTFNVELFDMNSRSVAVFTDKRELNIRSLPAGQYLCRVISAGNEGYVMITKDN